MNIPARPTHSGHRRRVALPFCHITLSASKPTKLPTVLNTTGDHIRKRRFELGLFQRQVAELLGVDECTVTNWEKHRTKQQLRLIPKIIEFLGYNPLGQDPENIGERVFQYRKCCGVSQKELAKRIGIDATTLSRLEKNKGRMFPSVLKKLTDFLRGIQSRTQQHDTEL